MKNMCTTIFFFLPRDHQYHLFEVSQLYYVNTSAYKPTYINKYIQWYHWCLHDAEIETFE